MIIPINLNLQSSSSESVHSFPPQLAQLGTSELVILEMQGSFHVEGSNANEEAKGKMVAKLTFGEVSLGYFARLIGSMLANAIVSLG